MSRRGMTAAAVALVLLAGCRDGPGRPTAPGTPTAPSSQLPTALRIEGPSSLAPGASGQYQAIASFADGRTEDVTGGASWTLGPPSSFNPPVLLVTSRGIVSGGAPGEADVTAYYPAGLDTADGVVFPPGTGTLSSKIRVFVLEPNTYRVSGRVADSDGPLHARVTVVTGTGAGQSTLSKDSDGSYAFYGLAGAVTLEVSVESFQTETRTIVVNDHQRVDFSLQPAAGYVSVTGEWRLTVRAAPSCGADIPEAAATRTLQASLTQRGGALSFTLTSPAIVEDVRYLPFGSVGPDRLDFYLQMDPDQTPPGWVLLERLEPGWFLGIGGNGRGVRTGNTVIGTLSGEFSVYKATGTVYRAPGTALERSCRRLTTSPIPTSDTHSFRLDRNDRQRLLAPRRPRTSSRAAWPTSLAALLHMTSSCDPTRPPACASRVDRPSASVLIISPRVRRSV